MRNLLKIITVFAFLVGNVFILSGCDGGGGGDGDAADVNVVGTWSGVDNIGLHSTVTFNANMTWSGSGSGRSLTGTYIVTGNSIAGSASNGYTFTGTIDGNTMKVRDSGGATATFTRIK